MASWSCLPPEIKQHVVKRLDFMSRHSLRHTSRLDRQIVDSTKCQVPRVRFGYKEGRGLIVVYTGIDQFLRWEFGLRGHDIVIHKFDSTYDLNLGVGASINFEKKNQDKVGLLLHFIFRVFHFLFASSAIHIRVMEFELSGIKKKDIQSIRGILYDMIKMLTERIGVLALCGGDTEMIFALASYFKGYKGKRRIHHFDMIISDESLVPVNSQSNTTMMGRSISETTVYVMDSDYLPTQYRALTDEDNNMPEEYKTHPLLNTLRIPNSRFNNENGRYEKRGMVKWAKITDCGQVFRAIPKAHENLFMKHFKSTECGLGDLCKRCSDPFDYWYTQNLPRRLYFEPFWDGFVNKTPRDGINWNVEMRKLRRKIEKDENRKKKNRKVNMKKKGKKVTKVRVPSWGFGENADSFNILSTAEVKVSYREEITTTVSRAISTLMSVLPASNYIKCLLASFILPISIAVFYYFLI